MNARATFAIARKDAVEILLNRSALVTVLSPVFVALLFAALNALLSGKATPVLIYNPDSSRVENVLTGGPFPNVQVSRAASAEQVAAAFGSSGSAYALGLAVPSGYDAAVRQGLRPPLALYLNGDDVDAATGRLLAVALAGYGEAGADPAASVKTVTINPQPQQTAPALGVYLSMFGLMSAFIVSAAVVAGLLLEEKEKGTLRLLLAGPASLGDIVAAKLLVGLGYQQLLVLVVLAIQGGYVGAVSWVLAFGLLGSLLGLALGFIFGALAQNTSAFGAFIALVSAFYTLPALFVGPLGQALRNSTLVQALQVFPTYYLARGILDALAGSLTPGDVLLDASITAAFAALVFAVALWSLRARVQTMTDPTQVAR